MKRRQWYRDGVEGATALEREIEAGLPWACLLLAIVALLIKWGGNG